MKLQNYLIGGIAASAMTAAIVAPANAQVTTAGIRGVVATEAGAPVTGAVVTVTDERTGRSSTTTVSEGGFFSARNLSVGGTYTVTAGAEGFQTQTIENVSLALGDTTDVSFTLTADAARTLETVVVTASAADVVDVATGPSSVFGLEVLESAPAINRSIKDILRLDPRVFVDESFAGAVQCAGGNPRFNSLTVDGVRLNDGFGLNSNGFPTQRQPFSFDAIEQVAIELAPFDVQYGGFESCNINAVTKSGGNDFFGGVFIDYTSDDFQGDSLEGDEIVAPEFDEIRYGFNIGGPILEDRLFFFASYEKLEGQDTFERGPEGSGAINEVVGFTQQDFDDILSIAQNLYQYDPGGLPTSFDVEDEKLLIRLDWNINDQHRASFVYNYNEGFNITESDGDADEFEYSNHLYERGAELKSYVGSVFSDWTPNFSTEFRLGYVELLNRQISVGGTDFGEMQIRVGPNTVYIGGDDSRQSNSLNYDVLNFVGKGIYTVGDHAITFGYEREELDIFNLFIQHSETEIRFNSIADFGAGIASQIEYNNAPSGNPADAAAVWGYATNTFYIQDEFQAADNLNLTFGLRYDYYTSDDLPEENAGFVADYGFSNSQNLDGEGLIQPRIGFTWDVKDNLQLRGGFGVFSGGNPNVWLSNAYSGNNVLQFGARLRDSNGIDLFSLDYSDAEAGVPNGPGWAIPTDLVNQVATGTGRNFEINLIDPDFEIPSEWKFSLGGTYYADLPINNFLGGEYIITGDALYTEGRNSAKIARLDLVQTGTTAGGLIPDYSSPLEDAFMITNVNGLGKQIWNLSASVFKEYDNGFDWSVGYSWTDAKEVQPMTSSVAFSNYNNRSFVDPEADVLATSNYNIEHRFVIRTNYERAFFGDYMTNISAVTLINSGRPFSFTFSDPNAIYGFTPFLSGDVLLYGPQGGQINLSGGTDADGNLLTQDPNIVVAPGFDVDAFNAYARANGIGGGFQERNSFEGDWWTKIDLKVEQEFPGFRPGDRSSAFFVIENFTNLLNDEWGILEQPDFPGNVNIVDASVNANGFVYESFNGRSTQSREGQPSLWKLRFGVRYEF